MVLEVEFRSFSEISEKAIIQSTNCNTSGENHKNLGIAFADYQKHQQIYRYSTTFSKLQNVCFSPSQNLAHLELSLSQAIECRQLL